jgi:hypothetical protein
LDIKNVHSIPNQGKEAVVQLNYSDLGRFLEHLVVLADHPKSRQIERFQSSTGIESNQNLRIHDELKGKHHMLLLAYNQFTVFCIIGISLLQKPHLNVVAEMHT